MTQPTPFRSILTMRLASLRNKALNLKSDSVTKGFIVVFGLGNVIGIGFWVSFICFQHVEKIEAFGGILNDKMISLLFFTLFILVVLSTILVAYTTVFLARETEFYFQHPIPPRTVLSTKLAEAIAFSSWASLFLCLPVLVSFGWLRKAPWTYYLEAAGVLTVFLLFAGFAGTALAMLIAPVVRRLTGRQLLGASGVLLLILGYAFLRSFDIWGLDEKSELLVLDRFMSQLSTMSSPYFPGHWASSAIFAATTGQHQEVLFHAATLLANTLVFLPVFSWYGKRFYGREWLAARDAATATGSNVGSNVDSKRRDRPAAGVKQYLSRMRSRSPLEALVWKDILIFLRDPAQLSQSILFILLMIIYSLSLARIPPFHGRLQYLVSFANLGAVCAILSSFTSRFIFPLVSLEGRAFWIVGLAPISRGYLVRQKAIFGLGITMTLGLATIVASNASLHSPAPLFLGAVYTVLLAGVCLTSLATGLGAAYPVFDEDNPARIAVGLGGTLNFFASALAVAVLVCLEALPYICFGFTPRWGWIYMSHALAFIFTVSLTLFCHRLGSQSLLRRDF